MQINIVRETIKKSETPEEKHLQFLEELRAEKRKGDWLLVGQMCGISSKNAELSYDRVYSKHHTQVVDALEKVIINRKSMLSK